MENSTTIHDDVQTSTENSFSQYFILNRQNIFLNTKHTVVGHAINRPKRMNIPVQVFFCFAFFILVVYKVYVLEKKIKKER